MAIRFKFGRLLRLIADYNPDAENRPWIIYEGKRVIDFGRSAIRPGQKMFFGEDRGANETFIKVTGFSKNSLRQLLKDFEVFEETGEWPPKGIDAEPIPPNPRYDFFMGIAKLLQCFENNGCPLIDPDDPEREPIVYHDIELDDGRVLKSWQQLYMLYWEGFPPEEVFYSEVLLSQDNPEQPTGEAGPVSQLVGLLMADYGLDQANKDDADYLLDYMVLERLSSQAREVLADVVKGHCETIGQSHRNLYATLATGLNTFLQERQNNGVVTTQNLIQLDSGEIGLDVFDQIRPRISQSRNQKPESNGAKRSGRRRKP